MLKNSLRNIYAQIRSELHKNQLRNAHKSEQEKHNIQQPRKRTVSRRMTAVIDESFHLRKGCVQQLVKYIIFVTKFSV